MIIDNDNDKYNNDIGPCTVRPDAPRKLRNLLREKFFGQQHAIEHIIQMFESHLSSPTSHNQRLTSFHIAGDNGCGKSYISKLFAEALYYQNNGLLIISGTNFQGSEEDVVNNI